jgi:hypothetical protein
LTRRDPNFSPVTGGLAPCRSFQAAPQWRRRGIRTPGIPLPRAPAKDSEPPDVDFWQPVSTPVRLGGRRAGFDAARSTPNEVCPMNADDFNTDEAVRSAIYALILPEMQALDPNEIMNVNLDVNVGVPKLLGALPEIRALRPEILVHLPTFRISLLDQLEEYAVALSWAHSLLVAATSAKNDLARVYVEAVRCRDGLYMLLPYTSHPQRPINLRT